VSCLLGLGFVGGRERMMDMALGNEMDIFSFTNLESLSISTNGLEIAVGR
jgi:hypothetical protein